MPWEDLGWEGHWREIKACNITARKYAECNEEEMLNKCIAEMKTVKKLHEWSLQLQKGKDTVEPWRAVVHGSFNRRTRALGEIIESLQDLYNAITRTDIASLSDYDARLSDIKKFPYHVQRWTSVYRGWRRDWKWMWWPRPRPYESPVEPVAWVASRISTKYDKDHGVIQNPGCSDQLNLVRLVNGKELIVKEGLK